MNKLFHFLIVLFILSHHTGESQAFRAFKVYQNTDLVKMKRSSWSDLQQKYISSEEYELSFNRISIASMWRSPTLFQEIEISYSTNSAPISWEPLPERNGVFKTKLNFYSLQYELGKPLRIKQKNLSILISGGLTPYLLQFDKTPRNILTYPVSQQYLGITMSANSHLIYSLTKRILVDLSLKLAVQDLRYEKNRIKNPSIPLSQQTNEEYAYTLLPGAYTARLGVGYKI
jgi:hypothetical protein